jgi:hypothetical protein
VSTPVDTLDRPTDAAGEIFDPELHSTKPDGSPSLKSDGTFRKRRRDSGGTRARGVRAAARARVTGSVPSPSKIEQQQKQKHTKAVMDTLAIPVAVLSFVDPVDAYCAQELSPMLAGALADFAQEQPRVAAVLDKLASSGAAATLLTVGLLGVVQFAHNHGKIPTPYARMLGATPRSEIERILDQRAQAMAEMGADDVVAAA